MIDRTQLTEALNKTGLAEFMVNEDTEPRHVRIVRDAAKAWLDFPTDEQVEAAAQAIYDAHQAGAGGLDAARRALEAVRQTMIGDNPK